MPGVPLNLDIPLDSEAVATYLPKLKLAIQTIQADVEPKVVPSEIDINANLDVAGYDLVSVHQIQLEGSADTSGTAGTMLFYNGDWYLISNNGAVRVTENGFLSGTGQRGFVGDYGIGGNPAAATFVDAASVYQFTTDPGVYADLEFRHIIIHGSLAKYTIQLSNTAPADKTVTLDATMIPTTVGRALLTCDNTGKVESTDGNAVTVPTTFGAKVTLAAATDLAHSTFKRSFGPQEQINASVPGNSFNKNTANGTIQGGASTGGVTYLIRLDGWRTGDRITGLTFTYKVNAINDDITTIDVFQLDAAGVATTGTPNVTSINNVPDTNWHTQVETLSSPIDIADGDVVYLKLVPAQASMSFGSVSVSYTHP